MVAIFASSSSMSKREHGVVAFAKRRVLSTRAAVVDVKMEGAVLSESHVFM